MNYNRGSRDFTVQENPARDVGAVAWRANPVERSSRSKTVYYGVFVVAKKFTAEKSEVTRKNLLEG